LLLLNSLVHSGPQYQTYFSFCQYHVFSCSTYSSAIKMEAIQSQIWEDSILFICLFFFFNEFWRFLYSSFCQHIPSLLYRYIKPYWQP
jgi:hypothetical protein